MEKFDVMFSSDNRYIDIMLGSIYSFLLNSNIKDIRIHIISSNFSLEDYKKVEDFIASFKDVDLFFYPIEDFDIEKYSIPNWRGSQIANSRLFFSTILKAELLNIKNILYLDSDTITVGDLTDLDNYKNGLYAVKDGCLKHYIKKLNVNNYYNSGVIFINVNEWIKNDYEQKIVKFIENSDIKLNFPDQDIFNCALSNYVQKLPLNYNLSPHAYIFNNFFNNLYYNSKYRNIGSDEISTAKENPKILHSYGLSGIKPWHSKFNPYCDEYMKYILAVNPDFKADELDQIKSLISKFPYLYRAILLMRTYNSKNIEEKVRSLALKCQQYNSKDI